MANPWVTLDSKLIYENQWLRLREDSVLRPDGRPGIYSVLEIMPSVGIIALDDSGRIALVTQWRYVHNKLSVEIPTGASGPSEDLQVSAERELREETGLAASSWRELGSIDNCNGATTDVAHIFLATQLSQGDSDQDPEESIELGWCDFNDAVNMVMMGEITESTSVAAILKTEILRRSGEISIS